MQNGLGAGDEVRAALPGHAGSLVGAGVTAQAAMIAEPGTVIHTGFGPTLIGIGGRTDQRAAPDLTRRSARIAASGRGDTWPTGRAEAGRRSESEGKRQTKRSNQPFKQRLRITEEWCENVAKRKVNCKNKNLASVGRRKEKEEKDRNFRCDFLLWAKFRLSKFRFLED